MSVFDIIINKKGFKTMKKIFNLILISILLPLASCGNSNTSQSTSVAWKEVDWNNPQYGTSELVEGAKLDVYGIDDTHGACEYLPENNEPGINRLSNYIKKEQESNPNGNVFVSAGDMFQGSLDSNIENGALMIEWMKYMKIDAMALGNHEFDWGIATLESNINKLKDTSSSDWSIPLLACNVYKNDEQVLGENSTVFIKNGFKVGIIGSIASSIKSSIDSTIVADYTFKNPTNIVIDEAQRLRYYGADIIIYATHGNDKTVQPKIADYVDVVLAGHDHINNASAITGSKKTVPVLNAGCNGRYLDHATFKYENGQVKYVSSNVEGPIIDDNTLIEDVGSKAIYDKYLAKTYTDGPVNGTLNSMKTSIVGKTTDITLRDYVNAATVCSLFTRVQLSEYETSDGVIASFYNAARTGWATGDKTYQDIYKAFPFDNTTLIINATGDQIRGWSSIPNTFKEGYNITTLESQTIYKVVTCTFIINNLGVQYQSIEKQYTGVYQRHVMYNGFLHASSNELVTV